MKIRLKLFASLRECIPGTAGACDVEMQEHCTARDVLAGFSIPADIPLIILINGIQKTASDSLQDGDTLSVFPPIAGG